MSGCVHPIRRETVWLATIGTVSYSFPVHTPSHTPSHTIIAVDPGVPAGAVMLEWNGKCWIERK